MKYMQKPGATKEATQTKGVRTTGRMQVVCLALAAVVLLPLFASTLSAQSVALDVFTNGLGVGFQDRSSSPRDFANTAFVRSGVSLQWDPQSWSGLTLAAKAPIAITNYGALEFWVNGGVGGQQEFTVEVKSGTELVAGAAVTKLLGHAIQPDTWEKVVLPIAASELIRDTSVVDQVVLYADTATLQLPVYIDDMTITLRTSSSLPGVAAPTYPTALPIACLQRQIRVMPLGDSLTEYAESYRGPLSRALLANGFNVKFVGSSNIPPVGGGDPYNEGHGGAGIGPGTPNNISDQIGGWLAAEQPDVILLDLGANDVGARRSLAIQAPGKLVGLLSRITNYLPKVRVLVADVPPNGWALDTFIEQQDVNEMAHFLGGLSATDTVTHVPIWPRLRSGWNTQSDTYDNVHFTVSGGQRFAAAWKPEVENVLRELRCDSTGPTTSIPAVTMAPTTTLLSNPGLTSIAPSSTTTTTTIFGTTVSGFGIGNQVFDDRNNNGLLDSNEPGVDGVVVRLFSNQLATGRSMVTAGGGYYGFNGLEAGTAFQVCVDPVSEFIGSNGLGLAAIRTGDPTANDPNNYLDNDDNGKTLWDGSHCTGHIIVDALRPLNQRVDIGLVGLIGDSSTSTVPPSITTTTIPLSTTSTTTTNTTTTTLTPTNTTTTRPATSTGEFSIGNQVFNDANNNGVFDADESGVPGVTVRLRKNQQHTGAIAITSADGFYEFGALAPSSDYQVCVDLPSGFVGSNGTGSGWLRSDDITANDPNNYVDNDDNGKTLWDGSHCTGHIIINQQIPANRRVDIGIVRR